MRQIFAQLTRPFRRFVGDDRASITVEVVMILPLLLWGYFGMFILFDGYRALSANIRASHTISDLLSRETAVITPDYIEGLKDILDVLTQSQHRTVLRVTVARYDESADDHTLRWSYATLGQSAVSAGNFDTDIVPYLPPMPNGSEQIVIETWVAFVPFMNISLEGLYTPGGSERVVFGPFYFESLVTTRPRFAGQLAWDDSGAI